MSTRLNVALGALALVAVTASTYAVVSVNRAPEVDGTYDPPSVQEMNAANTAAILPPAEAATWTLEDARAVLDQDRALISVLGDSTGNDGGEWVDLWVQGLDGDVTMSTLLVPGDDNERFMDQAQWDGPDGGDVHVWNASIPGTRANVALDNLDIVIPQTPDLVLVNYGHNHTMGNVAQIGALLDAITEAAPDAVPVVVLQQPQLNDANVAVRNWIKRIADNRGVPTIDVAAAFADDGRPVEELLYDELHPNGDGSRIWADAVADALS